MSPFELVAITEATAAILGAPFVWCPVPGGIVSLIDASAHGGTSGGEYDVAPFAIAQLPITNTQYQHFLNDLDGYANPAWWAYSLPGTQYQKDRPKPIPTAFAGAELPRTRVSWFDSMAFCAWLSSRLENQVPHAERPACQVQDLATWRVRLPTEQEWQRAAVGDTGWHYPWGNDLDATRANYANHVGSASSVRQYAAGVSPYGALDMIGNLWEWCVTPWGQDSLDPSGYTYRVMKGGAWNVSLPEALRATDRYGHPPRGRLNDAGFRCVLCY